MIRGFIEQEVSKELTSQGLTHSQATSFALKAGDYFEKSICNSRDPFKDCCDYAGEMAAKSIVGFKYKSPKAKSRTRAKKPQEAFKF